MVLHVEPETLPAVPPAAGGDDSECEPTPLAGPAGPEAASRVRVSAETPPAGQAALEARDRRCRFPGCQARRCDSHHVEHWADGGATKLSNLVRLCRRHHRAVHEEGFTVRLDARGAAEFHWPDGRRLPAVPAAPQWAGPALAPAAARLRSAGIRIGPDTATPAGGGGRLDVAYALDVLWVPRTAPGRPSAAGPAPAG